MRKGTNRGFNNGKLHGANAGKNKGLFRGTYSGLNAHPYLTPSILDFTPPTWSHQSFQFALGSSQLFTGDATASTTINNTIVGASAKFTVWIWVKRTVTGATQVLWCRDNSTTLVRQFSVFYTSADKMQIQFWDTSSTKNLVWTSTNTYTETRSHELWVAVLDMTQAGNAKFEAVYRNPITGITATQEAGSAVNNNSFVSVNNTVANNVNIGGRTTVANYSSSIINQLGIINTNLTADQVGLIHNNRVPFDVRTNTTLNANLTFFMQSDNSSTFSGNWTWTDLIGGGIFTSTNMSASDMVNDAPALKQITVLGDSGQSNDCSRVSMTQIPSRFKAELRWMKFWNVNTFQNANWILNNNQYIQPLNQFGHEYFLSEMLNFQFAKTIYYFKVSNGGTSLAYEGNSNNWRYPDGSQGLGGALYQQLHNDDLPALMEWELANGYTITKFPYLWVQGEADAQVQAEALAYGANEIALWTHASYGMFTLIQQQFHIQPYLFDYLLGRFQTAPVLLYKDDVNAGKETNRLSNTTFYRTISMDTAPTYDGTHYNILGHEIMARGGFDSIKKDNYY